ncbi:type II toxin-antitoxin system RelE/ParE family toxin [Robertkochia solimangrovi]|uniref:type II toxin-antitoxin system RelE/ParE family toxin n=1 Tax=Robertkochia solimangrovi TaxID=2213046 RepID=UPI0011805424|nr:type II toxin-antitoxin system RelE/ParE family toxin [Robertkochia solimangrovi]TRZ46348.1 type II toxin-antitoxin system RelE/ParE family toxin [Robertkochia solimangrovi]
MAKYKLSLVAKEDLIRIHQFGVHKFGERQADLYFTTLFKHFELIAEQPFSLESVEHLRTGYRRCVCGADTIYYRINNDHVEIMAIIGKQDANLII